MEVDKEILSKAIIKSGKAKTHKYTKHYLVAGVIALAIIAGVSLVGIIFAGDSINQNNSNNIIIEGDFIQESHAEQPTLWSDLSHDQRNAIRAEGFVLFPEVIAYRKPQKYTRLEQWLMDEKNIFKKNVRDIYSSGGRRRFNLNNIEIEVSAALYRLLNNRNDISILIDQVDNKILSHAWGQIVTNKNKKQVWSSLIHENVKSHSLGDKTTSLILEYIAQ